MAGFQKGVSGNPGGRPKGINRVKVLRSLIDVPALIETLKASAAAGDTAAAKLLLERALPALKPVELGIKLPIGNDLAGSGQTVIEAVGKGTLTPNQGQAIMGALSGLAKLVETTELIARIEQLEARQ